MNGNGSPVGNQPTPSEGTESYCQTLMPLLPAYSLGMAAPEEIRLVEALLPLCPEGQAALADYQRIRDSLLTMVPLDEAPPPVDTLLQRLHTASPQPSRRSASAPALAPIPHVNGYGTARQVPQPETHSSSTPLYVSPASPQRRRGWQWLAVACLLVGFVAANLFWAAQLDGLRREQQAFLQTLAARDGAASTFNAANHHRVLLPAEAVAQNTEASFVWNSTDQVGALVVNGLPALQAGETYQLWLVREAHSLSLGTFQVDPAGVGVLIFQAAEPIEDFNHIGVSVEPLGGTAAPTTPHLIIGNV